MSYRGTDTKQGFFAKDFNIKDTLSSHVGILLYEDSDWVIYNVNDYKDGLSDLRKENLYSYYDIAKESIMFASIYEIVNTNLIRKKNLIKKLKIYDTLKIKFDRLFILNNSKKLYCSEFVRNTLFNVDSINLNFPTQKKQLKGIYKTYFKKDTLEYYPVDIFQGNPNIKKIFEWKFE